MPKSFVQTQVLSCSRPLQRQQVQRCGFPDPQDRQSGMDLSAMMRLVIEEMHQRRTQLLLERPARRILVFQDAIVAGLLYRSNEFADPVVLLLPRRTKRSEIVVQDLVQPIRLRP